jgi:hypothetical protein
MISFCFAASTLTTTGVAQQELLHCFAGAFLPALQRGTTYQCSVLKKVALFLRAIGVALFCSATLCSALPEGIAEYGTAAQHYFFFYWCSGTLN